MAVTGLIPMSVLPVLGVLSGADVAAAYGHPLILLLMGGFMLSRALTYSDTHRQLAVRILHVLRADSAQRLIWGFMITAALLSMWISNTATTLMLLPIALACIEGKVDAKVRATVILSIAYAASIGGIATPVGTPPNLILMGVYEEVTGNTVTFLQWMQYGVPLVALFIPLAAWIMTRRLPGKVDFDLPEKQALSSHQKRVLLVFALTAILWVTRKAPFGGWSEILNVALTHVSHANSALILTQANDAAVAFLAIILLFVIPAGKNADQKLLDWRTAREIPWGILILFAGGITLAKGFGASGLSTSIGEQLSGMATWPQWLMILVICLSVTFLTEVTSNTATTTLLMPILAVAAVAADTHPLMMMIPAAMSASCAFMLPVATAPNAIAFGSGYVPIQTMVRKGIVMNFCGVFCITLTVMILLNPV